MNNKHNIVIASANKAKYSETFIKNQVKHLPTNIHYFHTNFLPTLYSYNDNPFLKNTILYKVQSFIGEKLYNHNEEYYLKKSIKKYIIKNNINLVLAQYGPVGVEMMDICEETKTPLIVYFHGFDAYRHDILKSYSKKYTKLFSITNKIFVVSNDMKAQLYNLGAPSKKIIYNPCGVNTNFFSYNDVSKNPPIFLFVGRFVEKKNPMMAIRAFNEVYKEIRDAKLILVGDGTLKTKCENLVNSLDLNKAITFMGIQPNENIHKLMAKSRIFLQPSTCPISGDKEGTPVSIMEASLSGLPIVSTKHGGIIDVVINKKSGFLVDEDDFKAMAKHMIQLSIDDKLVSSFGKMGNKHIMKNFTLTKNIDTIWDTILTIIN